MSNARSIRLSRPASRGWQIGLWTAQIVLVALLAMAGMMKTILDPHALPAMGIVALSLLVAWGRAHKLPIPPRS